MSEQNQNKITQEQFLEKQQLLETEMRQQSSLIAALQQQLLSATQNTKRDGINEENSSALVEAVRDPKVPDVPYFNGDPKKSFEFLSQLNIFFMLQPTRFSSGLHKSYYLGIRCAGPAAIWFSNVVSRPDSSVILGNFSHFIAQFETIFADPTRTQDAERRLLILKQGKRSVAQMLPEFQTLVFITGWEEKNLFRIFLDTLNDDVRDELLRENRPSSFSEYVTRAITIDRQLTERRHDRQSRNRTQPTPNHQIDHSTPMDLSQLTTRRGPLSPEERKSRMDNNLCIVCASPSHHKIDCPSRRAQPGFHIRQ